MTGLEPLKLKRSGSRGLPSLGTGPNGPPAETAALWDRPNGQAADTAPSARLNERPVFRLPVVRLLVSLSIPRIFAGWHSVIAAIRIVPSLNTTSSFDHFLRNVVELMMHASTLSQFADDFSFRYAGTCEVEWPLR